MRFSAPSFLYLPQGDVDFCEFLCSCVQIGKLHLARVRQHSELVQVVADGFLLPQDFFETIHDDDALIELAKKPDTIGFLLPAMEKSQLFRGVIADGVLPRKTFSMGHSREKRYYLEGRKIK